MSSVLSGISQNSRAGSHLVVYMASATYFVADATQGTATLAEGLRSSVGATAGVVRADGTNITFDTAANAAKYITAATNPTVTATALTGFTIAPAVATQGTMYRDMGKNIYIHVIAANGVPLLFAIMTRVETVAGPAAEGESAPTTGYVATWANQTLSASAGSTVPFVKIGVARIGSGHAF
jgi:hypothetical protein